MHCVDLGESFPTSIYLQKLASIQPRTSPCEIDSRFQDCKIDRLLHITIYFMNSGCKNGCNNTTVLVMGKFDLRVGFRFYTRAGYKTETKVTPSLLRSTCQLLQRSTIYFRTNSNFVQKHFSYFYGRGWPRGRKQTETTTDKQTNKQQGTFENILERPHRSF